MPSPRKKMTFLGFAVPYGFMPETGTARSPTAIAVPTPARATAPAAASEMVRLFIEAQAVSQACDRCYGGVARPMAVVTQGQGRSAADRPRQLEQDQFLVVRATTSGVATYADREGIVVDHDDLVAALDVEVRPGSHATLGEAVDQREWHLAVGVVQLDAALHGLVGERRGDRV